MKNLTTRILVFPGIALASYALPAQSEEHTFERPTEASVTWHGALPDNVLIEDPSQVTTRDLNANDPMIAPFLNLLGIYTKFVEENLKGFDGSMGQRDAAFHAINLILVTGVVWPPTLTASGAAIGAIALAETGPGALAGGIAGGTIGGVAGTGVMCAQMLLAVKIALDMNDKYPPEGSAAVRTRDLGMADVELPPFEWPEEWVVEDLRAALTELQNGGAEEVAERGFDTKKMALMTSRHAGKWESLFIHLIREATAPQIDQLARHWVNFPGLSNAHKQQLQRAAGLRPIIEQIAYIRANGRLSRNSLPAMPLSNWQQRVSRLLQADKGEVQKVWLDAFAIGRTKLSVQSNRMSWTTPVGLRQVGAPSSLTAPVSPVQTRVSGFGGSLAAQIKPGNFSIELGEASISGDRIRVGMKIPKGRLFELSVAGSLGPANHTMRSAPTLRRDLRGFLEFQVKGLGLELTRVNLGALDLNLGLPSLPAVLKPLEGLVKQLETKIHQSVTELVGKNLDFGRIFDQLDKYVPQQVLAILNRSAGDFGLASVEKLTSLSLRNGKLGAQVEAMAWQGVPSLTAGLRSHGARLQQLAR